jgi:hypothetical protein
MFNLPPETRGTGIPWYRRDNYRRVLEVMADHEKLPTTFDKWQGRAEMAERQLKREGQLVFRVPLDADEFAQWCRGNGHATDAAGAWLGRTYLFMSVFEGRTNSS